MTDLVKVSVDLGHGRHASFAWLPGAIRAKGVPAGVVVRHQQDPLTKGHAVGLMWAGSEPVVTLDSLEPLTVDGWFECSCGEVGTIRDGRWVASDLETEEQAS